MVIHIVITCKIYDILQERQFMENQQERMDKHMKQLTETHRQKIAMLESQFLQQKQQLLRGKYT